MGRENRKFQGKIIGTLFLSLVVFLAAPSVFADQQNNTPAVGDKATLNLNESLILNMDNYASVNVECAGKQAKLEFSGTNSSNNFVFKSNIPIPMGETRFDSATFWSRNDGGSSPQVKFKCIKTKPGFTVTVTIISLTPK
jgi:hypothetical protein